MNTTTPTPRLGRLGARKAISLSQEELVRTGPLRPGQRLPLVMQPGVRGLSLLTWAAGHAAHVEQKLHEHGAILFRNFGVSDAEGFEQFIRAVSGELLEYRERSSPRSRVADNVYTSTDYPKEYAIFLHNENSYQQVWPLKLFFFCQTAPPLGGATPIADCRGVYRRLDPKIVERFAERRWMYVRNFGDGMGLPWQTVFQTTDRAVVEQHCRRAGIEAEWKSGDRLRTRAVRPAVARHPRTGETVWFNHATFFHVSTLEQAVREELLRQFDEEDLPTNTYYGDGSPIEPSVLEEVREAYRQEEVSFPWQEGDVLMVDNMLVAHGRAPFDGPRKILVGMSQPLSRADL